MRGRWIGAGKSVEIYVTIQLMLIYSQLFLFECDKFPVINPANFFRTNCFNQCSLYTVSTFQPFNILWSACLTFSFLTRVSILLLTRRSRVLQFFYDCDRKFIVWWIYKRTNNKKKKDWNAVERRMKCDIISLLDVLLFFQFRGFVFFAILLFFCFFLSPIFDFLVLR